MEIRQQQRHDVFAVAAPAIRAGAKRLINDARFIQRHMNVIGGIVGAFAPSLKLAAAPDSIEDCAAVVVIFATCEALLCGTHPNLFQDTGDMMRLSVALIGG